MSKSNKLTWHTEQRKLGELIEWDKNPRQLTNHDAEHLKKSIDNFGIADPLIINTDNRIISGHMRRRIMLQDGYNPDDLVDVRVPDRVLTEREAEELAIRLNKNSGSWNFDALANNFEFDDLIEWGFSDEELMGLDFVDTEPPDDPGAQIDRAEELREKWGVQTGQMWKLNEHRLICGDCTDRAVVERVMGGERAQAVFIDPPYMTFGSSTGKLESGDFNMLAPFWDIVVKTAQENLDDGRAAFICCDWRSYPTLFKAAFTHMTVKNLIVWDLGGALKMGSGNFRPSYELLIYAINNRFGGNWLDKQHGAWKIEDRSARDLWTIKQSEAAPGVNRKHSSQKPVELSDYALGNIAREGEIVFDYFSGSGTVLVSCERLGMRCRAIEIDPSYVAVAIQRWVDMTGGTPELITANRE